MWVKTTIGQIVNIDATYCIGYIEPKNITVAWWTGGSNYLEDYLTLAVGDKTQQIAEALCKGRNYMEVH